MSSPRIAPEAIRRRIVRADTLRITADSSTVRSGSRRQARRTAAPCLLRDRCSSRSRTFVLEQRPAETWASAQGGMLGGRIFGPDFNGPGTDLLLSSTATMVEPPSATLSPSNRIPPVGGKERRTGAKVASFALTGSEHQARSRNPVRISGGSASRRSAIARR